MAVFARPSIRFISVSQGIDTNDEQADVLLAVHGLVDSLYIKEPGKKTHRGIEGRALAGFITGGRCFGYRNEPGPDGVRQVSTTPKPSLSCGSSSCQRAGCHSRRSRRLLMLIAFHHRASEKERSAPAGTRRRSEPCCGTRSTQDG